MGSIWCIFKRKENALTPSLCIWEEKEQRKFKSALQIKLKELLCPSAVASAEVLQKAPLTVEKAHIYWRCVNCKASFDLMTRQLTCLLKQNTKQKVCFSFGFWVSPSLQN